MGGHLRCLYSVLTTVRGLSCFTKLLQHCRPFHPFTPLEWTNTQAIDDPPLLASDDRTRTGSQVQFSTFRSDVSLAI